MQQPIVSSDPPGDFGGDVAGLEFDILPQPSSSRNDANLTLTCALPHEIRHLGQGGSSGYGQNAGRI
ncbi:hypothetical protein SDC9_194615 [bioreactor metagenome]|uniref:Uncharacterized protein n=1 Tax=bioreactor metagenome TaxID=1076179 RepID=A0A645I6S1_9ZZZZ